MTGSGLKAGASSVSIEFPQATWPLDGFGSESDPLHVRTLLLEVDAERAAIVVLDMTSLAPEPLAAVTAIAAAELGLRDDRLLVGVSHTFNAPHLASSAVADESAARMQLAREAVLAAVRESARDALSALRPATVATAETTCAINVNRDVETRDGWGLGRDESGFANRALTVVRLTDADGQDIAILANYAVQPSAMIDYLDSAGLRVVSSDLAGAAMRHVEESVPGAVGFFLIGAAGDQAPSFAETDESASYVLGARLGAAIVGAPWGASEGSAAPLWLAAHSLILAGQQAVDRLAFRPTRSHEYVAAAARELPFWILTLNRIAIVAVQVELSAEWASRVRAASPFALTLVVTMVNGGDKYLPDASSYDRMTYEALSSRYARGGAELLEQAVHDELRLLAARRN